MRTTIGSANLRIDENGDIILTDQFNFNDAKDWKENESNIQATIIDNLNRRNGEYSPDKLAKIKESGSSDVFIGLTGVKCRAFESFVQFYIGGTMRCLNNSSLTYQNQRDPKQSKGN